MTGPQAPEELRNKLHNNMAKTVDERQVAALEIIAEMLIDIRTSLRGFSFNKK